MDTKYKCDCKEPLVIIYNEQELLCSRCGFVCETCNIQNENHKIIEEKGVAKKVFVSSFQKPYQNPLFNHDSNYKRHKNVKEIISLCEKFLPLQKDDKEDIENQIEKYSINSKESCHNLKALVASAFYIKCNENKKFINLKDFLKELNIKHKHFFKYHENLKRIVIPIKKNVEDKNQNDFEEIFEKLFQKFAFFISTKRGEQKKFDMITNFYKPPSNFSKNHKTLFFVKFSESSELMTKTKNLVYTKTKFLYNIPDIQFLKNGKSPWNFISAIIVLIFQSFELKLTKNEFSSLFEIPYCTLSRIMKEIEKCMYEKYESIGLKGSSNNEFSTENNKSECDNLSESLEKTANEEQREVKEEQKQVNKKRKEIIRYIFKNIQNLFSFKEKDRDCTINNEIKNSSSIETFLNKNLE